MKKYKIVFSPEARTEALDAAAYIADTAPMTALRWYQGLERTLTRLESFPRRCAIAPESLFLNEELRHQHYKILTHYLYRGATSNGPRASYPARKTTPSRPSRRRIRRHFGLAESR